jgi:hypothetical protein
VSLALVLLAHTKGKRGKKDLFGACGLRGVVSDNNEHQRARKKGTTIRARREGQREKRWRWKGGASRYNRKRTVVRVSTPPSSSLGTWCRIQSIGKEEEETKTKGKMMKERKRDRRESEGQKKTTTKKDDESERWKRWRKVVCVCEGKEKKKKREKKRRG